MMGLQSSLANYFTANGVDSDSAERCARAIVKWGATGGAVGFSMGVATANPSALLMAAVGAVGGSTIAATMSPSCHAVRSMVHEVLQSKMAFN